MIIRPATSEDYKALMALYNDFVEEDRYSGLDSDSFQAVIASKQNFILVAEDESKGVIGFITASLRPVVRYPQPIMQVDELYVDPGFRKHGLGGQFIQAVEDIASQNNCRRIYVESAYKHVLAHEFYEKNGLAKSGYYFLKKS